MAPEEDARDGQKVNTEADDDDQADTGIPLESAQRIMKETPLPDLKNISADSGLLVARATELFIQKLAEQAAEELKDKAPGGDSLSYSALAGVVQEQSRLEFLRDIVPERQPGDAKRRKSVALG